jgi:hypothetical protein
MWHALSVIKWGLTSFKYSISTLMKWSNVMRFAIVIPQNNLYKFWLQRQDLLLAIIPQVIPAPKPILAIAGCHTLGSVSAVLC